MVYNMPNIYELVVAAILEKAGHEVRYRNFVLDNASKEKFFDFIGRDDSDCYIFWSVNLSVSTDMRAQRCIRECRSHSYCLFLGPGSAFYASSFLTESTAIVVRGEPEYTVRELVERMSANEDWRHIRGISYYDAEAGGIVDNPPRPLIQNLDELPFPAIHFIERYAFSNPKLKISPYMAMVTSRNCPFKCIYCVPGSLTFAREMEYKRLNNRKPPVGFRSTGNVIAEIEMLAAKGYRAIGFMDDNFLVTKKRLREIGEALRKNNIAWGCQARVDAIDEEMAALLQHYNCRYIDLGVESFDDEVLKYIKKDITEQQIYRAVRLLKQHSVPVKINILIGASPLDTAGTIKETLRKAKKLKVDQVMFNIVSPFPGTELYDLAKENGWLEGDEYRPTDVQRSSILNYPNLTSRQMERLLRRNNLRFFLSPRFIWHNIRKFSSFSDFRIALKALVIKLFG